MAQRRVRRGAVRMQQTGDRCSAESGEAHLVSAQQRLAIGERACAGGLHPKKALCLGHFGLCGRQPSSSRWGGQARRRGAKGSESPVATRRRSSRGRIVLAGFEGRSVGSAAEQRRRQSVRYQCECEGQCEGEGEGEGRRRYCCLEHCWRWWQGPGRAPGRAVCSVRCSASVTTTQQRQRHDGKQQQGRSQPCSLRRRGPNGMQTRASSRRAAASSARQRHQLAASRGRDDRRQAGKPPTDEPRVAHEA